MSEVVLGIGGLLVGIVPPLGRALTYLLNNTNQNATIEPNALIEAFRRGLIESADYYGTFGNIGVDKAVADVLFQLSKQLNDPNDLLINLWRYSDKNDPNYLDPVAFKKAMNQIGLEGAELDRFMAARTFFPSIQDFLRFAVRDVFIPEYVKTYGMDLEQPADIFPQIAKLGMSQDVFKWYWEAHWELPSVSYAQLFKWFGVISDDDLNRLLRAQGWEPYWRDKFKAILYNPYTRVDARRMYQLGVLNDDQYVANYMKLGYDEEHAKNLLAFAKAESQSGNKELTKTYVLDLYKEGKIKRDDAIKHLEALGYSADDSDYIVSLTDYQLQTEDQKNEISAEHDTLLSGLITLDDAVKDLDNLNLEASYRDRLVAQWTREVASKRKLPTKAELVKMYQNKLLTKTQFEDYLGRIGYAEDIIALYENLIDTTGAL